MSTLIEKIKKLSDELSQYTISYNNGHPEITDREWDTKYEQLVELEQRLNVFRPNSPTRQIYDFSTVSELKKVKHNHLMLSLAKTKKESEVESFIGNEAAIAMLKLDGLTCSLTYKNGVLVRAETRGDGEIGEDVTHNIIAVSNIPKVLPGMWTGSIDGEIICPYDEFEKINENNDYKNPRNYAAGSIRLLDSQECSHRNLKFIAWDSFPETGFYVYLTDKLIELEDFGFDVVPGFINNASVYENNDDFITQSIKALRNIAKAENLPIDGIVFKYNDCQVYLSKGKTAHHFKGGLAYKFYDEESTSRLIDINWTMGKTGVLTPVAKFEPIVIEQTEISRASLHNVSILKAILGKPYKGQKITVYKANMIIPQIASAEQAETNQHFIDYPKICPVCGSPTQLRFSENNVENLYCTNKECLGTRVTLLKHFCGKKGLDIKGLSEKTLDSLYKWGYISSFEDIFNLRQYKKEWVEKPNFGEKKVNKILDGIDSAISNCELWKFLSSVSIPQIGVTFAKKLARRFQTYADLRNHIKEGFLDVDGISFKINKILTDESNYIIGDSICDRITMINSLYEGDTRTDNDNRVTNKCNKKKIVITGKLVHYKRDELKDLIEAAGGTVTGAVSGKTDLLINNDKESNTAKNKKAKEIGIPILSEEEFLEEYLGKKDE